MSTPSAVDRPDARSGARVGLAGALGYIGALGHIGMAAAQAFDPRTPDDAGYVLRSGVAMVSALLLGGTVIALARSGAAGRVGVVRIGLVTAALGWVVTAVAPLVPQLRPGDDGSLSALATSMIVVGMLPAAVAVLRGPQWRGWRRWVPLLCAAYPVVVATALGRPSSTTPLAAAGWGLCWLALGVALLIPRRRPRSSLHPRGNGGSR
jgi:hypothetical protein